LARPLLRSDNLAVAREVHKMAREADEVTSRVDEDFLFKRRTSTSGDEWGQTREEEEDRPMKGMI
jgi:hypothetical protein